MNIMQVALASLLVAGLPTVVRAQQGNAAGSPIHEASLEQQQDAMAARRVTSQGLTQASLGNVTKAGAVSVTADEECLVNVPAWDFNWQQLYQFSQPLALKPGTRLKLSCTWDNGSDKTVRWGEGTDDEMCLNYFYLTR